MNKIFLLFIFLFCPLVLFPQMEKQIPIVAWYGVSRNESSVERFLELRQSGITHNFTTYTSIQELNVAMDAAEKAGIKMIIDCPELKANPEKTVMSFKEHPALAGYFIKDEPNKQLFPELKKWIDRIQSIDKEHFCYINLPPNYATSKALGAKSYKEYIELFTDFFSIPILSFDHYPIVKNGLGKLVMRSNWYENLEFISYKARKMRKPFWAFARTVAYSSSPVPTLAEIRLQVFSNLAYGAQGIQYFTYWTPTPLGAYNFHNAPIEFKTKKKTEVYDYIKMVNQDVKALSFVFLNSKVISVAHTGREIPKGTLRLTQLPKVITKFETNGLGAVVSVLKKGSFSYLVVVNRDFEKSMSLVIKGDKKVNRVLKSGLKVRLGENDNKIFIDAGDMVVFEWRD